MPKVINAHHLPKGTPLNTGGLVYIGRPSKWGNPFAIGKHGDRAQVIEQYRAYLMSNEKLIASLPELQGKDLVCWCAPASCHGDVLIEMVNQTGDAAP